MHDLLAGKPGDFALLLRGRRRFQAAWFAEVDLVAAQRKRAPFGTDDLLDGLLSARDADTGLPLPAHEFRSQVATFSAAGVETTARLLF